MALEPGSKRNSISDLAPILPITVLKKVKRESEDTVTFVSLLCEGAEAGTASGIEFSDVARGGARGPGPPGTITGPPWENLGPPQKILGPQKSFTHKNNSKTV